MTSSEPKNLGPTYNQIVLVIDDDQPAEHWLELNNTGYSDSFILAINQFACNHP